MPARPERRQRGVAIITALLIVAIATTVSVSISTDLQLDVRRTANIIARDQALVYALAAESWAGRILQADRKDNAIDHLGDVWAIEIPPLPVEGGYIRGRITDLHACFNLNSLVPADAAGTLARERFERLLTGRELPPNLSQALIDWLDDDVVTTIPDGAEDGYYMGLPNPYRSANNRMYSKSELRLVRGFEDAAVYNRLLPEVCALPVSIPINVNTASAAVLLSLSPSLTESDVQLILERRLEDPFDNITEFTGFNGLGDKLSKVDSLGVSSTYFLVETESKTAQVTARMFSVIERDESGSTRVIQRSQSVL